MSGPYGTNKGDVWLASGSPVQDQLDRNGSGQLMIHEMMRKDGELQDAVYVTDDPELIARAERGQRMLGTVLCPRCASDRYTPYGSEYPPTGFMPPALSRMDNETYICSACGTDEAMRDYWRQPPVPPDEWPTRTHPEFGLGAG